MNKENVKEALQEDSPLILIISIMILFVLYGFAIQNLWNWFILPLGLPSISFWHALGIYAFANILMSTRGISLNEELKLTLLVPIMCLSIGYIAHINM